MGDASEKSKLRLTEAFGMFLLVGTATIQVLSKPHQGTTDCKAHGLENRVDD